MSVYFFRDGITLDILYIILIQGNVGATEIGSLLRVNKTFNKTLSDVTTKRKLAQPIGPNFSTRFQTLDGILSYLVDNLKVKDWTTVCRSYIPKTKDVTLLSTIFVCRRYNMDPEDEVDTDKYEDLARYTDLTERAVQMFTLAVTTSQWSRNKSVTETDGVVRARIHPSRILFSSENHDMTTHHWFHRASDFTRKSEGRALDATSLAYDYDTEEEDEKTEEPEEFVGEWHEIERLLLDKIRYYMDFGYEFGNGLLQTVDKNDLIINVPYNAFKVPLAKYNTFVRTPIDGINLESVIVKPCSTWSRPTRAVIPQRITRLIDNAYLDHPYFRELKLVK